MHDIPGIPIYQRIARTIQTRIFHGIYQPGATIPTEIALGAEFGVSRLTVRQAIRLLREQGALVARRGAGTFVTRQPNQMRPVTFIGYLEDLIMQSLTMETVVGQVGEMAPTEHIRQQLQLPPRARVFHIERTRLVDGEPVVYAHNYLPLRLGRRIPAAQLATRSVNRLLDEISDAPVSQAQQTLTAVAAGDDVAAALRVPPGAPLLYSEILMLTDSGPVEYAEVNFRPDRSFFTATLMGHGGDLQTSHPERRNGATPTRS